MQDRTWTWSRRFAAPPAQVWSQISNTDRFNRAIGLPPVRFESVSHPYGFRRTGRFQILGMNIAWDEFPFEFVENQHISVLRRYHNGPLTEMESVIRLTPDGDGTLLSHTIRVKPRNGLGALIAWYQVGIDSARRIQAVHRTLEESVRIGVPYYKPPAALNGSLRGELAGVLKEVEHAEMLLDFLTTAAAEELMFIRPFRLAREWGIPRGDALRLFLKATKLGVFEAAWSLICPHCRGVQEEASSLRGLHFEAQHCPSCAVDFEADFDQLTELRFHLSPRWKALQVDTFCVGGPSKTPHVVGQFRVPGKGKLEIPLSLPEGLFRFRAGGDNKPVRIEVSLQGSPHAACLLSDSGVAVSENHWFPNTSLSVQNEGADERTVVLERTEWADDACTAAYVTTFQDFRDLFGSDVLAAGVAVKVAYVTILFTDLKGSTALYQKAGDAPAFGLVSEHFDRLIDVIGEHQGAVVKTIGDAVMAAFLDPADAVRAAVAMHASVADLDSPDGEPVLLKIGVHAGPCFAVTLSDRLDYFGTTVNLAARIQNEAQGGDIVLHRSLADQPAIRQVLGSYAAAPFSANLKGIDGAQELQRFLVQSLPA